MRSAGDIKIVDRRCYGYEAAGKRAGGDVIECAARVSLQRCRRRAYNRGNGCFRTVCRTNGRHTAQRDPLGIERIPQRVILSALQTLKVSEQRVILVIKLVLAGAVRAVEVVAGGLARGSNTHGGIVGVKDPGQLE